MAVRMGPTSLRLLIAAGLAFGVAACENRSPVSDPPEVEYLNAPGTEDLGLPFSAAVRVNDTLYLSGQIGNLPGTLDLAPGGIQGETRQTMENIKQALQHFGSSMDRVVKCTVFLADMNEWGAMNEVYRTYFETPPARSALGASGLALNGRVEIECIAVVDPE
jgi:2-iminobutanoate/2-iminopropanoate deaminase